MSDWKIELSGEALQPAYQVYVVKLVYKGREWFYVGQTGDRNYIGARLAVSRLAGHLGGRPKSTENQVHRFIREKMGCPEQVLPEARVIMESYRLAYFNPSVTPEHHAELRREAEEMERHVGQAFLRAGKVLMNKLPAPRLNCSRPDILQQVKADFGMSST